MMPDRVPAGEWTCLPSVRAKASDADCAAAVRPDCCNAYRVARYAFHPWHRVVAPARTTATGAIGRHAACDNEAMLSPAPLCLRSELLARDGRSCASASPDARASRPHRLLACIAFTAAAALAAPALAQIDPTRRDLVEFGYDQPLEGHAPVAAYVDYYLNRPQFRDARHALRLAISPVYLDGELDIRDALGANTDVGIGVNGGGYAYDYNEIRAGRWLRDQSFTGHGGGASLSVYHLFNPGALIPLNAVLQGAFRYVAYERDSHNPPAFAIPKNQPIASVRAGLRFGGIEPVLAPARAAELSAWYEGQVRFEPGTYGDGNDRRVESSVHLFWARGLLTYTLPQSRERLSLQVIGGTSIHPDRLSAYRLGGTFALASDFPLGVPGYYEGELSARHFVLVSGAFAMPIDRAEHWQLGVGAAAAHVGYTEGLDQTRAWNSGMSVGLDYAADAKRWKASLVYGHAFDAIRAGRRGGDSLTMMVELDLERMGYLKSDVAPDRHRD
jgi:hypothetical protein